MSEMVSLSYCMSNTSNQFSEAMIESGRGFEERARADPALSTNQVEDNARFRSYVHASNFWSEMSAMHMAVHETLLKHYQHLNRRAAGFFQKHSSNDVGDKLIREYDKMLKRVEKVAGFHLPADLEYVTGKASEDAHLNPGCRKHAPPESEYASRPRHTYPPPGACPVSGLTHGQAPHPLESPAMYSGTFRRRWGELDIKASQIMRETSSGDEKFKTLLETRDNLMMSLAKKHDDALRDLESDFLSRIVVGLTNTSFDKLKDVYLKADEWSSVVGLQTYAGQLSLGESQAELDEPLESSPRRPVAGSEFVNDGWQPSYQWEFGFDAVGRALSPGLPPGDLTEERVEGEGNESESDDPASDGSTIQEDSEPGPDAPGGGGPRPPGGNSGSNSVGGASSSGRSGNPARGPGGRGSSADSRSYSSYAGSGSSYEGNQRPFEGLQESLSEQMIYELSDNESPSINSDSPSISSPDSDLGINSLNTTQTSLGSTSDLSKSPKGPSSGSYTLAMTQRVPEAAVTSVSPDTGPTKVALGKKGGKQKLSDAIFGIVDISMGSKTVQGLGPEVAQAQNPFVNSFEDIPMALSTLLEDPDDDSVDGYKVIHTGHKHRHLRRVPRFIILQGGKLKVFGRYDSYTGTGLKTKSLARDQPLADYQRLNSSSSLPVPLACDVAVKSAGPLNDPRSSVLPISGPGNSLFHKNAGGQAAGTIPQ